MIAVLIGTQLPDLVDKPLAWQFGVLTSGRSLGHSLLTAAVLLVVVTALLRYADRSELAFPLALGHVLHLVTDLPSAVLSGDFSRATFLLWPVLPSPVYETEPTFSAHLQTLEVAPAHVAQMLLLLGILLLTFSDTVTERHGQSE